MAGRGHSNGGNWQEKGSPYWNSQAEPEIDVWDPSSVSAGSYAGSTESRQTPTAQINNTPSSYQQITHSVSTRSYADSTESRQTPSTQSNNVLSSYQQSPNSNRYGQNDASANWGNSHGPSQTIYRHPNSNSQPSSPPNPSTNYNTQTVNPDSQLYDNYQPSGGIAVAPTHNDSQSNYFLQQFSSNNASSGNVSYQATPTQTADWPVGSWRSQPSANSDRGSNYSEPLEMSTAKKFTNPLMNADNGAADNTADLIKQMHIQGKRDQQNANNGRRNPSMLSKASLAMLQNDLQQAAVPFESAENLELARNIHLGLVDVTANIGQKVVISNLSAEAANFVPRAPPPVVEQHVPEQAPQEQEDTLIKNLEFFIENVLKQPGSFDELSSLLIDQVKYYLHSDETVKEMVKIIFTKAIDEDNFKYLGARLCEKLTMLNILSNFRSIFLNHFQAEFKSIRELVEKNHKEDTNKIHGFFMFMAEIYIHIKINGAPVKALGRSLSKSFEKLLSNLTITNVTFVCKLLKLAGGRLLDAFHESEADMENYQKTFEILKRFSDEQKDKEIEESKRIVLLISSVSRLKDSNWGRTKSNTRPKSAIEDPEEYGDVLSEVDQNYYMNEPVFFTPEGVQYTAAEAQIPEFYQQHLAKFGIPNFPLSEDGESLPWSQNASAFDDFVPSDEEAELYRQDSQDSEYNREFERFLADSGQLP